MTIESYRTWRCRRVALIVFALCGVLLPVMRAEARPAGTIHIDAWYYDRGNARVFPNPDIYADYRDKHPDLVVGGGGQTPWTIEYDVDFPVDAKWTLRVCYGSPGERPLEIWIDNRRVGEGCGRVTGNPPPYPDRHPRRETPRDARGFHGLEWEEGCTMQVTKGKHTLKLTRKGPPPRLRALRLESPVAFPKDWRGQRRELDISRIPPTHRRIFLPAGSVNTGALRLAIEDVTTTYGKRYPKGPEYLKRLAALEIEHATAKAAVKAEAAKKAAAPKEEKTDSPPAPTPAEAALQKAAKALAALQSEALLSHPLLDFDKLLFVRRGSWGSSHIYNCYGGGGTDTNICILSPVAPDGKATDVAPQLTEGGFAQFDLSFDAKKLVFAYSKKGKGSCRIYEMGIDGTGVRQLTFDADEAKQIERYGHSTYGRYFDMDPCYLPDGNIMFVSTRPGRAVSCHPSIVTSLHLITADRKGMRCLSGGQFNELDPNVLDDGRVAYMRWEYVDKGFGNVQALWSVRPDGSYSDHLYKNNLVRPAAMTGARSIPGSEKFVVISGAHGGPPHGGVVVLDTRRDRRNADAMTNITPEIPYGGMGQLGSGHGFFRHPYALSEKLFLVAHHPLGKKDARWGIYVLDAWGNRTLLHEHPTMDCYHPMVLRPRRMPVRIPPVAMQGDAVPDAPATMLMQDVYRGLTGIERGRVKYIRVMEVMPTTWEQTRSGGTGQQVAAVSLCADVGRKKVHGIATVHEDGSAAFTVPPNANIFFQALDENFMEIQRMRTFINLMPGEKRSCIGCHEIRSTAPPVIPVMAMRTGVQPLSPQPGETGPRFVHYESDVQPVLDRHCAGCHSGENPKGDLDLSNTLTGLWRVSYENLIRKDLVGHLDGGFGSSNVPLEKPMTFGSHQSKMIKQMRNPPCNVKLTREEFIRIVTWVDANCPFYGTHKGCKSAGGKDRPDFRPVPLADK